MTFSTYFLARRLITGTLTNGNPTSRSTSAIPRSRSSRCPSSGRVLPRCIQCYATTTGGSIRAWFGMAPRKTPSNSNPCHVQQYSCKSSSRDRRASARKANVWNSRVWSSRPSRSNSCGSSATSPRTRTTRSRGRLSPSSRNPPTWTHTSATRQLSTTIWPNGPGSWTPSWLLGRPSSRWKLSQSISNPNFRRTQQSTRNSKWKHVSKGSVSSKRRRRKRKVPAQALAARRKRKLRLREPTGVLLLVPVRRKKATLWTCATTWSKSQAGLRQLGLRGNLESLRRVLPTRALLSGRCTAPTLADTNG